jgi:hypothetical protein
MKTVVLTPGRIISGLYLTLAALALTSNSVAQAQTNYAATTGFGNYYQLFTADSPWNSRPTNPTLGTYQIKKPVYNPTWVPVVSGGALSVGVFMAKASDPAVTIYGKTGQTGVADPDSGVYRNITLPHWPAGVVPATGGDGHADIVDVTTGILHSFYQLRVTNGRWTAAMYSWTRVDGRGFGDADHWSQGARASGVAPAAGLIRKHEIDDGAAYYKHALAMSLPSQTMSNGISSPSYVYPATAADSNAATHTGMIPLGARMMLPASFDTSKLSTPALRKVANTLKIYGAYVVDTNYDTAFAINVENGANFNLMPTGWDGNVVAGLELIRAALRQVTAAQSWVDGNGKTVAAPAPASILSMRGTWGITGGYTAGPGSFQTWQQAIVFPTTANRISQTTYTNISKVSWAKPIVGETMRFKSVATGGARIRLQVKTGNAVAFDSGYLQNDTAATFAWPSTSAGAISLVLIAESGVNTASSARGVLSTD